MSTDRLAGKPMKEIRDLGKSIDELKKLLENIARFEKTYLDEAATEHERARKYKGKCDGYKESKHLKRKERAEQRAKFLADLRPLVLEMLASIESLKKKKIEALQDEDLTTQKTRASCFFF